MPNKLNLRKQRFGRLVARYPTKKRSGSNVIWKCCCDCGNYKEVSSNSLRNGNIRSCGCLRKEELAKRRLVNLKNKRFGRLIVRRITKKRSSNNIVWKCRCDCGGVIFVSSNNLRNGSTKSCGCLQRDNSKKMTTHGKCKIPEYKIWTSMKQRCYNKKSKDYKNYGGRGIKVCQKWRRSFMNFFEDMGKRPSPKLTLERINNDKGYFLKNCKWATRKEQRNNRRKRIKT